MTINDQAIEWVDADKRLYELCDQWQRQKVIAIDTEFIRSRTFFPIIGLLQVADDTGAYLIDPLAINDKQSFRDLLQNSQVIKVLHACSEDLEVFNRYLGVLPDPIFDTQIAAGFVGYGASIGYANLVFEIFGEPVPKHETRSDWLQRPLSESQRKYAALDVMYLIKVYPTLLAQLQTFNRLSWVESDCKQLLDNFQRGDRGEEYYRRVKSAWKLQAEQLLVLKALCEWREQQVRQMDIPRNRLVKDVTLWDIAYKLPDSLRQLNRMQDIHRRFIEKHGKSCLHIVKTAQQQRDNCSMPLPPPLAPEEVSLFKRLKQKLNTVADSLSLPAEMLARKKDLEFLVRRAQQSANIELPVGLQGWRREVIGQILINELNDG